MEIKLVKDKLMTGNFSVVDIYLEGLKPRLEKQWQKIGKKPKKKELELVDISAIENSIAEAKKDRSDWDKKTGNKEGDKKEEEKKVDINTKIVKSMIFDNGLMVSSLKEMRETLPSIDEEVFKIHVNEDKNEIANWVEKNINPEIGKKLKNARTKEEIVKILNELNKKEDSKDDKK
jgi:hypothetical protein